jgi:hypothetical protein
MWEEYSEFSYAGDPRYKIRDLFIDEKTGVTCDIVYRSGKLAEECTCFFNRLRRRHRLGVTTVGATVQAKHGRDLQA